MRKRKGSRINDVRIICIKRGLIIYYILYFYHISIIIFIFKNLYWDPYNSKNKTNNSIYHNVINCIDKKYNT